jgi:hypothetical protein
MAYVCKVCRQLVQKEPHQCPGKEVASASAKILWGLPRVGINELNSYNFPDLSAILDQLDHYLNSLRVTAAGKGSAWPALSRSLKLNSEITDPGMVLVLGNPRQIAGGCDCDVLNRSLPGVSYRTKHSQFKGPETFTFTNLSAASEFFQKTGAINIMPSDASYAGDKPATQLTEGRILVNAHSGCEPGLLVHEIIHAYGGPAGMFGEGLTDWFTLDLMQQWGKPYPGNPAYGYNVTLVDRVVQIAGKERVARMAFSSDAALASLKGKETRKVLGKDKLMDINYRTVLAARESVTNLALKAQESTMIASGFGDKMATMVPLPATAQDETAAGLPGAIARLGQLLNLLMPD